MLGPAKVQLQVSDSIWPMRNPYDRKASNARDERQHDFPKFRLILSIIWLTLRRTFCSLLH